MYNPGKRPSSISGGDHLSEILFLYREIHGIELEWLDSVVSHLLDDGYDIRTVQELLGHKDVSVTMIYTHILNRGGKGVMSPADRF